MTGVQTCALPIWLAQLADCSAAVTTEFENVPARSLAVLAVLLSCIGLYGLMAYHVSRRTGEIGVRMALGAQAADVARSILREALVLAGFGIAIGLPAAFAVTRLIHGQLYGAERGPGCADRKSVV